MKKQNRAPQKAHGAKPNARPSSKSGQAARVGSAPASKHGGKNHKALGPRGQVRGRPVAQPPKDTARWVVGLHSCAEALRVRPRSVREVWLRDDWTTSQALTELHELATENGVLIRERSPGQLDQVGSGHQGVALACTKSPKINWDHLAATESAVVLLLDGIEDPHNLGSILRTAWLTGVKAIVIPSDRAVGLTPAACKVASGGAEHVAVEDEPNLVSVMERLKEAGFWIYGLAEAGTRAPWGFDLPKKVAWVVGNEGGGIRKATERACDELVRIPQVKTGSSYNASIATAIALAETCRQLGTPE